MKIYTSYYAKTKSLIENNIIPISVSLFTPKYLKNEIKIHLKNLAPTYIMLSMEEDIYTPKYKKILNKLNYNDVINDIRFFTRDKDCALMCYETPDDFCHRHLLAEWLNENTEFDIKEWIEAPKKKKIEIKQTVLF